MRVASFDGTPEIAEPVALAVQESLYLRMVAVGVEEVDPACAGIETRCGSKDLGRE
jgi:hypothetical protein